MIWYTADEHYEHFNIIKYTNRPFSSLFEMNKTIIANNNLLVKSDDMVIHLGDFTLSKDKQRVFEIINSLNGSHIFIKGSHDYWLKWYKPYANQIDERTIENQFIVGCHYCMRTWARSHWNSWHVFGHSHGTLEPIGKSWDVGVDNNNFKPVSFEKLKQIMSKRPDNVNFIKKG